MPRLLLLPIDARRLTGFARRDACQVPGHQLYAVEKWCVDRTRLVSLLVVYTGHADHSVLLDVFHTDDLALFDRTIAALRADGARPKQTEHGTLMVTSLAHFRSDYAIVPIPHGRFLPAVRDQLYANIDLLRIGASGRTALTLEDPTEATKERFASTYHIPSADVDLVQAVLRLVSLIQSALAIFDLYPHPIDGLLCDATLNAIRQWTASVGTPCLSLSPPPDKPIPDPPFVAALFSLVLSSRNKLADRGYPLPLDPFSRPSSFFPLLSPDIVQAISSSKQDKHALINPTTDLASFVSQVTSPPSLSSHPGATKREQSLSLVAAAVTTDSSSALDHLNSLASLRALWAPNLSSSLVFPRSRPSRSSRVHTSRGGAASDGDGDQQSHSWRQSKPGRYFDGARSTEEDSDVARHAFRWKGKLGSWAGGLSKRKHQSVDLSATSSRNSSLRGGHPSLGSILPPIPPPKDKSKRTKSPIAKLPQSQSQPQSRTNTLNLGHESTQCLSLLTTNLNLAVPTRTQSHTSSPKRDAPRRPGLPSRRSTVATVPEQGGSVNQDNNSARAQSPTLPPMGFFGEPEDDDLLSSGQVSPLSDTYTRPNPFQIYYQSSVQPTPTSTYLQPPTRPPLSSRQSSNINQSPLPTNSPTTIDEKVLSKLLLDSKQKQKRRNYHHHSNFGPQARIASWAGPVRVGGGEASEEGGEGDENELEEQESDASFMHHAAPPLLPSKGISDRGGTGKMPTAMASGRKPTLPEPGLPSASTPASAWAGKKEKARFHSLLSVVDGDGQLHEEVELGMDSGGGIGSGGGGGGSAGSEDGEVEWYRGKGERGVEHEEDDEEEDEEFDEEEEERLEMSRRRARAFEPRRRRSFHDLDTFREVDVLSPERMKIDVELCGQCLIMWRREKHLQNVLNSIRHISTSLSTSNTSLRTHLSTHHPPSHLSSLTSPSSLLLLPIPATDEMAQKSERYKQGTNVLRYETEQFAVKELWAAASAMRRKVWDLREGVFGADAGSANASWGGDEQQQQQRRPLLPPGVHGAHGPFNRLQWRLDGQSVLVDQLGRTEGEAEEEALLDAELEISGSAAPGGGLANGPATAATPSTALPSGAVGRHIGGPAEAEGGAGLKPSSAEEEDSDDVADHPGIKPVWLLRFFTSWRARWSAVAANSSSAPAGASTLIPSAAAASATSGASTPTLVLNNSSSADDTNANVLLGRGDAASEVTLMSAISKLGGDATKEVQQPIAEKLDLEGDRSVLEVATLDT